VGWQTAGFSAGGPLARELGAGRGFEIYDERGGGAQAVLGRAADWLRAERMEAGRFFLFAQTSELRAPWAVEAAGLSAAELASLWAGFSGAVESPDGEHEARLIELYEASCARVDRAVAALWTALEEAGLEQDTLLVVTAGAGFALGEHGSWLRHGVWREVLEVPLLLVGPGIPSGREWPRPVQAVDLVPSLLELAGMQSGGLLQGSSFAPNLGGGLQSWDPSWTPFESRQGSGAVARWGRYRLIAWPAGPRPLLFDLGHDPNEFANLIMQEPEVSTLLSEWMFERAEEDAELVGLWPASVVHMTPKAQEVFTSLGY